MSRPKKWQPWSGIQQDTSAGQEKLAARRYAIAALEERGIALHVLDLYAGMGWVWSQCYQQACSYVGLDSRDFPGDRRRLFVCTNTRWLRHVDVDLTPFTLFDADAYGSPWYALACVFQRVTQPVFAVAFTDGAGTNAKLNGLDAGLLTFVGVSRHRGGHVWAEEKLTLYRMALRKMAAQAGYELVSSRLWHVTQRNNPMLYGGCLFQRIPSKDAAALVEAGSARLEIGARSRNAHQSHADLSPAPS